MSLGENPRPTKTQAAAELLKAGRSSHVGLYPHDLHPGLVPGLSVEDQNKSFSLDRVVFFVTAPLIVAFSSWGIASPESVSTASAAAYDWAMNNAAWLLNLDRKSTRLNSSHVSISYAVFCLKKKRKKHAR